MTNNNAMSLVIVGHVDHGKSTLIGRLLYDTGCASPEKIEEVQQSSELFQYAHLVDYLEEERAEGKTIDTSQIFFQTPKRHYVIIDAPGHKEFIKNMITGTSQAEAALVIVDIKEGIKEQTRRHLYLLKMLGIKQICVLINKMDLVDYSKDKFDQTQNEIKEIFDSLEIAPSCVIPVSLQQGVNITSISNKTPWYEGLTILQALDNFSPLEVENKPLRFPVQGIYQKDGQEIALGRLEAGHLKAGQEVTILPSGKTTTISSIKKSFDTVETATTGQCIGLTLEENTTLKRGELLIHTEDKDHPLVGNKIEAGIFWMVEAPFFMEAPLTFKCATQEIPCSITKIKRLFDPAFSQSSQENAQTINLAEVAEVEISLNKTAVVDSFNKYPEMGRFVLEHNGVPVAGGVI